MVIHIQVLTPQRLICSTTTDEVILPVLEGGSLGVLENHATLVTMLDTGLLRIKVNDKWTPIILFGGIAEIDRNRVTVLVNGVEEFSTLKLSLREAMEAVEKATLALLQAETKKDRMDAVAELKIANARSRGLTYLS